MDLKTEHLVGAASESKTDTNKRRRSPQDIVGKSEPAQFRVVSKTGFDWYLSNFKPKYGEDVVLCTMPKSGSTWLAVTCHLLRGGDLQFQDLNQAVPWHQLGWDLDWDPASKVNTMQRKLRPRLWKSHQLISGEKPNIRYITTIRDPISVLKSWHHFMTEKNVPGFVGHTVDEVFAGSPKLFRENMTRYSAPWKYLLEAYLLRDHPDVLVICFEDLQKDFTNMLPKIAWFLGLKKVPQDFLLRISQMTCKEQMSKDIEKYNENWSCKRLHEIGRSKIPWGNSDKVSFVKYAEPSEKTIKECGRLLEKKFSKHGLDIIKTYNDLRGAIKYSWKARPAALVSLV